MDLSITDNIIEWMFWILSLILLLTIISLSSKFIRSLLGVAFIGLMSLFLINGGSFEEVKEKFDEYKTNKTESVGIDNVSKNLTGIEYTPEKYKILEVLDGDTFKIFFQGKERLAQLIGLESPRRLNDLDYECYGLESHEQLRDLIEGEEFYLGLDKNIGAYDNNFRLLVILSNEQEMINTKMLENGYSRFKEYEDQPSLNNILKEAENEAKEKNKGLWGEVCNN